ncbi:methyl-accepting chemotaxis protein [Thiohalophilus sp.]|uniref:HAMP domain-containing methyl-accepting chemotaxis protein n=1 Tax=Thiohalophilus sp. TaxID=3028392 RepID=UPI0039760AA5
MSRSNETPFWSPVQSLFANFKISHKLWLGFGSMAVLLVIVSVTALTSLNRAQNKLGEVVEVSQPMVLASMQLADRLDRTSAALGFYLLSKEENDEQEYERNLRELDVELNQLKALTERVDAPQIEQRINDIARNIAEYATYKPRMLELASNFDQNQPGIGLSSSKMAPLAAEIQQYLSQMIRSESTEPATPQRRELLLEMVELRQIWMNVLNENRAFISFRGPSNMSNVKLYREGFLEALDKIADREALLTFEQLDAVESIRTLAQNYIAVQDELFRIHSGDQWRTDSHLIRTEIGPLVEAIKTDIDWLVNEQRTEVEASSRSLLTEVSATRGLVGTLLIIGLIVSVGGGLLLAGLITRPMRAAVTAMENISEGEGDLTRRLEVQGKDEMAQLATAFNKFADKIQETIKQVSGATTQIASAAEEMSIITNETSEGVNQQRNETEQVATAMNEMTATVQEVVNNAESAAEAAGNADNQAIEGRSVVNNTIDSIDRLASEVEKAANVINHLEKDSEQIGTVLEVIQGIAEQTNLLALNAAIEAARAGEQGRGFAVVADEVRNLASRTQESTEEIKQMIDKLQTGARDAVRVMEEGRNQAGSSVEQAGQAGQSLQSITEAVNRITSMNQQIAEAARQQGQVAEEINQSIVNITHVADSSSNSTEQLATASHDLARLSSELQTLVGRFKV